MSQRIDVAKLAPEGYRALVALERFLHGSTLPQVTYELVKLRVSQINGCGFCVDMHSHDAKKSGVSDEKLFSVAVWWESPFLSEEEKAALAVAEAATRIADNPNGVPDEVWERAAKYYDEETLAALIMAVAAINAWNRIGVTARLVPGSHRSSN